MKEIRDLPEAEKILEIPISYEERGKELGRKEGRVEGVKQVAMEMIKEGASLEFIFKVTKLTMEELEKLKKHI
ncbi:hypothetical protein [Oceanobacillus indicireducens]|uniref:Transposase n=2 Tax=Oceanobacillus TaxID=182709 RepID=A0A918D5Q4_9BACI|nr:hypothetical protein [Oceanobacillus indicireducens]GGN67434.1 hypothetical protein GCM10007971_38270 [Oceanobacillus indicireducens]